MSRDRGQYSPIARVLLDGPDYHKLPPIARHTFLALKVGFGPSGIEVQYQDALRMQLVHRTGWPISDIEVALEQLQEAGWIEIERNVVWIVGQLEFHPNMTPDLPKHCVGIQNHVAGLPRLAIVRRFIEHYAAYFASAADAANGYPMASDSHSNAIPKPIVSRSTQYADAVPNPPTAVASGVRPAAKPRRDTGRSFNLGPYIDAHREVFPDSEVPAARYGKVFKQLELKHGPDETLRRWRICLARKHTYASPEELGKHWSEYASDEPSVAPRSGVLAATEMLLEEVR